MRNQFGLPELSISLETVVKKQYTHLEPKSLNVRLATESESTNDKDLLVVEFILLTPANKKALEKSHAMHLMKATIAAWREGKDLVASLHNAVEDQMVPAIHPRVNHLKDNQERWIVHLGTKDFALTFWTVKTSLPAVHSLADLVRHAQQDRGRHWTATPDGKNALAKQWSYDVMDQDFDVHGAVSCGGVREFGRIVKPIASCDETTCRRGKFRNHLRPSRSRHKSLVAYSPRLLLSYLDRPFLPR